MNLRSLWIYDSHFSLCLGVSGLVLQLAAINSDQWAYVELMFAPICWSKSPIEFEWECWGIASVSDEAGRTGLWRVCYSFPMGVMPKFYFYTEPYCSNFSDDEIPAAWLAAVQILCKLTILYNLSGILVSSLGIYLRNHDFLWCGSALLQTGGTAGLIGSGLYYINMTLEFLVPYNRNNMAVHAHWAFHSFLDGAVLTLIAGLLHGRRTIRVV